MIKGTTDIELYNIFQTEGEENNILQRTNMGNEGEKYNFKLINTEINTFMLVNYMTEKLTG